MTLGDGDRMELGNLGKASHLEGQLSNNFHPSDSDLIVLIDQGSFVRLIFLIMGPFNSACD
ncbi:hypothetical protein WH5701_01620 [Synechococcus sp. WH 5701]|nr:hypothetical protein WH5701_01620 [Synechococcus sp. WH 5701]